MFVSSHLLSEMALMADNIVVIGKGKLIASTSVQELIQGGSHAHVLVRTPKTKELAAVLDKHQLAYVREQDGLVVRGAKTDEIGKLAFAAKIPILELTSKSASLEEAFLELTDDAQEYKTQADTGVRS